MTAPPDTATPTVEEFLGQAAERLEALCGMPMTGAEYELWRIAAQHQAALRMLAERLDARTGGQR